MSLTLKLKFTLFAIITTSILSISVHLGDTARTEYGCAGDCDNGYYCDPIGECAP